MKRTKDSLRDLWENIKHTNIRIIGVQEDVKKKGYEKSFEEIIVENFPNMEKGIIKFKRHEVPYRINPRRNTLRHILIKLAKIKNKENRSNKVTYKGNPTGLTTDFSAETLQARREWQDIF